MNDEIIKHDIAWSVAHTIEKVLRELEKRGLSDERFIHIYPCVKQALDKYRGDSQWEQLRRLPSDN